MIDEGLVPVANMRYIVMENPAEQVQVPPPQPASESESAMMWRPADIRNGEVERIPLNSESEQDVAAIYGAWLGASLLHTMIADAKKERREEPGLPKREDEDDSDKPKR